MFLLAILLSPALAAPQIAGVAQVGNPATPGTRYVFLYLQYLDGAKPHAAYAVYHKPGVADAPGNYQRLAVIRSTFHIPTIATFMQRAADAGFDNFALEAELDGMLPPGPYSSLAEKVAAFFQGTVPGGFAAQQKQAILKFHPQMALVVGQGYIARVPDSGPNTFEMRVYDPQTEAEGPAVARVTSPATPAFLPAPASLSEKLETTPRGHLRVHLRWCLPMPLNEMAFHWSGFKVFRVPNQSWNNAFGTNPPLNMTRELLLNASSQNPPLAIQVNRTPITPGEDLPCPVPAGSDTFFMTDDNDSAQQLAFESGGTGFPDGFGATYFVAALDHFGRIGDPSPGLPVTICDRLPPLAPSRVRVDNIYKQEGATDHALRISWQRDDEAEVARYHLFRYADSDDVLVDRQSPLWPATPDRIAVVNNPGSGERIHFTDTTPGALMLPADDGITRWFSIVAEDNTACPINGLGNLSGASGPVPGALYDLAGPDRPQGRLRVPCCALVVTNGPSGVTGGQLRLIGTRLDPRISWVEFRDIASGTFLGRHYFGNQMAVTLMPDLQPFWYFEARFGTASGLISGWVLATSDFESEHRWTASLDCGPSFGCPGGVIFPVDPGTGDYIPTCVQFNPPADVVEAALYRRLGDHGPYVLMTRQKLDSDGDGSNDVTELCEQAPPANPGRACYFIQYFDRNGNPSVVSLVDCINTLGTEGFPVPRITHFLPEELELPSGAEADATLAWFCPRPGVDRFEIAITPVPPGVATSIQEGNEAGVGEIWGVLDSDRPANGFGSNSPNFAISQLLERGKNYRARVRAVGEGIYGERATGDWSEEAAITWLLDDPAGAGGPTNCPVAWPARDIAPLITDPARELNAQIRVGWVDEIPGVGPQPATEIWINVGCFELGQVINGSEPGTSGLVPPRVSVTNLAGVLDVPLPFTVYLHQTSAASRGTMLQVSHYVDEILTTSPSPTEIDIIDRAFAMRRISETNPNLPHCLWFRVRQPLIAGRTYRCAVVLHGQDREPLEVLRTEEITVPSLP